MARISKKNPRYRTKEEICEDLAKVLSGDLTYGTKFAVVAEVIWVSSEFYGKYVGCPYWSEGAIALAEELRQVNSSIAAIYPKKFVHEHIAPRGLMIKYLFDLEPATPERIMAFLEEFCIGVVVTKEEDNALTAAGLRFTMPLDWNGSAPWQEVTTVDHF